MEDSALTLCLWEQNVALMWKQIISVAFQLQHMILGACQQNPTLFLSKAAFSLMTQLLFF